MTLSSQFHIAVVGDSSSIDWALETQSRHPAIFVVLTCAFLVGCAPKTTRIEYSVESLTKTLKDDDPDMRYWAAQSLGKFGAEAGPAVPVLTEALRDQDAMVRTGAAYALAEIGPPAASARAALIQAGKDSDKEVRDAATYALQRISGKNR